MNRLVFLLLVMMVFGSLQAQTLSATADKQQILIGEQLQLHIKATLPQNVPFTWLSIDTIPHFEIMERSKVDTTVNNNQLTLTQTLTLTSWDSGKWNIPPLNFEGGRSAPISVKVNWDLPFNPKQPYHDIKDIRDVKVEEPSNWYWYFLLAIILIALFLLFFSEKEKKENDKPVLDANAYQKALKQLDDLDDGRKDIETKQLYTKMLHIFRWYLQTGKGIQSYSKTTDDLSIKLKELNMPSGQFNELLQTLRLADLVKFAKYKPAESETKSALQNIRNSIITIEKRNAV